MNGWFLSSMLTTAAVLGIRWLVKDRVSCRVRYSLWLLVLLRLLIPVNIARSSLSLGQLLPMDAPAAVPELSTQIWYTYSTTAGEPAASGNVWRILWLVGAAAVLGFFGVSRLVLELRLRRDRVLQADACCPVPVYQTAAVQAPCLVGLFRPVVYVTESSIGRDSVRYVLLHEMTHLRHFDHLWSVLRCVALALHWFDPLAWVAAHLSREDAEVACDEGVLADLSRDEAFAYGSTLIQLSCNKGGVIMGMNSMLDGKAALRRRVEAIACRKRNRRSAVILAAVLCVMTAGCTFTDAPETTLPKPSVQMQTTITEPVRETVQAQPVLEVTEPQPGEDVWKERTKDILTDREEELLQAIPGFDSGEEWVEGFKQNIKSNMYYWRSEYGAENAGIVSVEEIFDDRAEPGIRIFEIRCFFGNPRQERSDYMIVSENCKAWTADLDSCRISGVFNDHHDEAHHGDHH